MIKNVCLILCLILLLGCNFKKEEISKQKYELYTPSEMSLLMRQMYAYNSVLRQDILEKDSLLALPDDFLNIHSAELTDPSERDSVFILLSTNYLNMQKEVLSERDSLKTNFNKTINSCVACHKLHCQGPIPKIKRLFIQ